MPFTVIILDQVFLLASSRGIIKLLSGSGQYVAAFSVHSQQTHISSGKRSSEAHWPIQYCGQEPIVKLYVPPSAQRVKKLEHSPFINAINHEFSTRPPTATLFLHQVEHQSDVFLNQDSSVIEPKMSVSVVVDEEVVKSALPSLSLLNNSNIKMNIAESSRRANRTIPGHNIGHSHQDKVCGSFNQSNLLKRPEVEILSTVTALRSFAERNPLVDHM